MITTLDDHISFHMSMAFCDGTLLETNRLLRTRIPPPPEGHGQARGGRRRRGGGRDEVGLCLFFVATELLLFAMRRVRSGHLPDRVSKLDGYPVPPGTQACQNCTISQKELLAGAQAGTRGSGRPKRCLEGQ